MQFSPQVANEFTAPLPLLFNLTVCHAIPEGRAMQNLLTGKQPLIGRVDRKGGCWPRGLRRRRRQRSSIHFPCSLFQSSDFSIYKHLFYNNSRRTFQFFSIPFQFFFNSFSILFQFFWEKKKKKKIPTPRGKQKKKPSLPPPKPHLLHTARSARQYRRGSHPFSLKVFQRRKENEEEKNEEKKNETKKLKEKKMK